MPTPREAILAADQAIADAVAASAVANSAASAAAARVADLEGIVSPVLAAYLALVDEPPVEDPPDEPPVEDPPVDPDLFPASATWEAKEEWIVDRAGVKSTVLRTVGVDGFIPAGCRWTGANLYVDTATVLEDLVVPGTIVPRGLSGPDITLRNVVAQDCFTWELGRILVVEDCEFTIPAARVMGGWGQGCLNALRPGFVVRRTVLRGGADGIQCAGGGAIEETLIEDLTVGPSSHCDFVQNYSGLVTVDRTVMRQILAEGQSGHLNGLFADRGQNAPAPGTYIVRDSVLAVDAPAGVNGYAANATPTKGGWIELDDSYVRGPVVGDVRFGPNVTRA